MVQPILASTLYNAAKLQSSTQNRDRIGSGHGGIDDALRGGVERGRITCISGERGTGKTLIALHIIVTYLLSQPTSQAAIIDTTGSLDILRLYTTLVSRLKTRQTAERRAAVSGAINPKVFHNESNDDIEATASQALDRVKIMRVFDFVGVSEAINELRDEIRNAEKDGRLAAAWGAEPTQKTHVADSQAEEDEEDIMLFDGSNDENVSEKPRIDPVSLIVVDNITSVVNPHLKTDYVQGQALLTTFMRSLSLFTRDSNLATILINNAASPRNAQPSFPGLAQLNRSADLPPSTFIADPLTAPSMSSLSEQPSIFASTTVRPSLGKTFAGLVHCHVLLSMVPKRRKDAEIIVGGKSGKAETVGILEVLMERRGDGAGRWAGFEIGGAGTELREPS